MTKIYIANLGAYNRGFLVGQWLELPTSEDEINEVIEEVLNGDEALASKSFEGEIDEEIAIHDFETDIEGLEISEYSNIIELNNLIDSYENLQDYEKNIVEAYLELIYNDLEYAIENVDNYYLIEAENTYDLGYYWVNEAGIYDLKEMGTLANDINYEALGRDYAYDGHGFSSKGFLMGG